jgi:hypothetical protein
MANKLKVFSESRARYSHLQVHFKQKFINELTAKKAITGRKQNSLDLCELIKKLFFTAASNEINNRKKIIEKAATQFFLFLLSPSLANNNYRKNN